MEKQFIIGEGLANAVLQYIGTNGTGETPVVQVIQLIEGMKQMEEYEPKDKPKLEAAN